MKHILSFDIAKNNSVFCLMNENRELIIEPTNINHNKCEFEKLYHQLAHLKDLEIIMESTSIYHLPVEHFFRGKDCLVFVLNPKLVKQFNDTLNKSKTDRLDCLKIARCYLATIDTIRFKNDQYFQFNLLARQYHSLVESIVRYKNRYRQLIDVVFPEFATIFSNLYDPVALQFIKNYPHPALFYKKRSDFLCRELARFNNSTQPFRYKPKVAKMKQLADDSLWFVHYDSFEVFNLVQMVNLIMFTEKEINKVKTLLINSLRDTELFQLITSIPFVFDLNAALFLAEVGDVTRFDCYSKLISFCGIDSVRKQSGKSINYNGPISKTGNKYVRKNLFNTCTQIITLSARNMPEHPIYLFFRRKQKENKHHYVTIIACSTKLCRIIFHLCKTGQFYKA